MKALNIINPTTPNLNSVAEYLITGLSDHREETFFQDIKELRPGQNLFIDLSKHSKEVATECYYKLKNIEGKTTQDQFEKELNESIKLHLRSDVKLGTCLSGGVDSSAIAALSANLMNEDEKKNFPSITAGSTQPEKDERTYARQVANHLSIPWHIVEPSYEDFSSELERCLFHQEARSLVHLSLCSNSS